MAKLTPKMLRFVDEYCIDCNATKAVVRAGYATRNADVVGPRLLKNSAVQEKINSKLTSLRKENDLKTLNRLERQAFWSKTLSNTMIKMRDRLKASELLGKSEGDFIERHEVIPVAEGHIDMSRFSNEQLDKFISGL